MILKGYIFALLYGVLCLAASLLAYKLGMPKKYSRKLVHILVGFEWVILSHYVGATYHFLIVCLIFTLLLLITHFKNLMPMISSDSDNAPGTVYYGVAMTVMSFICIFVPEMMLPFGIGVFCTSLGDGFAGVIGQLVKKMNPCIYANKTLFGMIANFAFSFGTARVFTLVYDMPLSIFQCVCIGLLSVGLEVVTGFGLDNITTTLGTAFLAYAFIHVSTIYNYIVPIILTSAIIGIVLEKKVLTRLGLLFAIMLDIIVSLTLGNVGFILLLSFLVLSVLADKVKKKSTSASAIVKKDGCRDHIQVMANGLIPMMAAILFSITANRVFLLAYVASLAEAFADTAASGFGSYAKSTFDPFRMKRSKPGLSGGMSLVGTLASLVSSFVMGSLALALGVLDVELMILVSVVAFIGAIFDSMLGSLLQIKYKCRICGEITEREVHCGKRTERLSGFYFFDNDVVNLFSGAFSAILVAVIYTLIC